MSATILTYSGRYFDFLDPAAYQLEIRDVAHGLSNICRYTGQCLEYYSVAQHAVLVSHLVPPWFARCGLHHDDAEAFLGDVSTPLKRLLPGYQDIESKTEASLRAQLKLPAEFHACIKEADRRILMTEKRDNLSKSPAGMNWSTLEADYPPYTFKIEPMAPKQAKEAYLDRHYELEHIYMAGKCA